MTAPATPLRKETTAPAGKPAGVLSIALFSPISRGGRMIDTVEIRPIKFDHQLRWNEGRFKGSLALLSELTGLDEPTLRDMVQHDAERVMAIFMVLLPAGIRADIEKGIVPVPSESAARQMPAGDPALFPETEDTEGPGFSVGE